ncbi:MAG: RagB/SusD family nutrient uptake outer membrane protein, partial [Lachnospiraceae bacterium]|nr:RagB/SusD family nutrient uptake outer membrane protein [Lachnospiraceae bacterium]
MKRLYFIIIVLAGLCSCEDFLQTDPKSTQTADQYYKNETEVQNAINGIYAWLGSPFQEVQFGEAPIFMLEYTTGQGKYTVGQQSTQNPDFERLVYWDRIYVDNWWSSCYYGIEASNMAIEAIKKLPLTEKLNSLLAEAYFFRAYYYFRLVRIFGDIPLKLTPTQNAADALLPKSSVKDIYEKAIIPSLLEAEKINILNTPSSGRVSNVAVKSVLAQVYLTMGGYPLNQIDKFALSAQKAKDVITAGNLALFQSDENLSWFEKIRRMDFDCQSEYVLMANYGNSPAPRQVFSQLVLPVGVNELTGFIQFGALMPRQEFINSFDSNDLR